jgi:hypothetical protein
LHLVDVFGDPGKRRLRVGKRQKIVEISDLVGRPCEMFGDKRRLVAIHESSKPSEMSGVDPLRAADGHADTMQRNRVVAPDAFERTVGRSARSHVVFSMNLEEAVPWSLGKYCAEVFVLEACASQTGDRVNRKAEQA